MNALSRIWTPLKATFTYAKWRSHGRNGVHIREGASSPRPVTPRLRPPGPPASGRTRQEPASHGPGRTRPTSTAPRRPGLPEPVHRPRPGRCGQACPQRPLAASPAPDEAVDHLPAETVATRRSRSPTRAGSSRPSRAATASRVALRGVRTRPGPGGVRCTPPRWAPGGPGPW